MSKKAAGILFALLVVLTVAMVFVPAWTIRPFVPQTEEEVALSYSLRRWAPAFTLVAAVAALALAVRVGRGSRWWVKGLLAVALLPVGLAAWFARQNHFEWMFKPPAGVEHAPAAEARWVETDDMVMAVEVNGDAVAYPVRQLAYHHIVQDVVGGEPVVATY